MRSDGASVAGVVLAAGLSTRMGRNKLFLPLGGSTVLRRAIETALEAALDPVFAVLGHESDRARDELAGVRCTPIVNEEYALGMNTSLRKGVREVPDEAAACVVLLADMPFVTAAMIAKLVATFRAGSAPLVISTYEGVVAPPVVYGRTLFPELRELSGEGCGKQVIKRHRAEAAEIAWPRSALSDLDVPADFESARVRIGGAGSACDGRRPEAAASNRGAGSACDGRRPEAAASNRGAGSACDGRRPEAAASNRGAGSACDGRRPEASAYDEEA